MKLIDSHTHLYLPEFDPDRDETVKRSLENQVIRLLMPNIDVTSIEPMLSTAEKFAGICYPMIGLHPTSVKEDWLLQLETIEKASSEKNFIAIGEIGIDLYWDKTFIAEQLIVFRRQIELALKMNLPVVIHSRDSMSEVFSVIEEFSGSHPKGVLHAFSGTLADAQRAMKLGFKLGIGGVVTFKNSGLGQIVKEIGLKHIILETDSPYLTPSPHRGKRNESSYIRLINKKIAEICNTSEEYTASVTFNNTIELFNI